MDPIQQREWRSFGRTDRGVTPSEVFDTVIEVIDLENAQVLARTQVPEVLEHVDGSDGLLWFSEETSDGTPLFNVRRPEITRRQTRR